MKIEYRSDYFGDAAAKASFERYAMMVFGLDFGRWKDRGLWDSRYLPFSAFVDGECVASICVYPSDMIIDGKKAKGAQLLTVGTLPEYRLRGIQRALWRQTNKWITAHCDFTFLFTDDSAAGFYRKLGLTRQQEFSEVVERPASSAAEKMRFRKLCIECDTDFTILRHLAHEREPVSERLGFRNPNLLLFMFLYYYRDSSYYLEDLDAVVVAEEAGNLLRIHDVVAKNTPRLADLGPFLARFQQRKIEFLFCTDRLEIEGTKKREVEESLLFVSDDFTLAGQFMFPSSIRA